MNEVINIGLVTYSVIVTLVALIGWVIAAYLFSWLFSGAWDRWRKGK